MQSLAISNYHVKHTSHLKDYRAISEQSKETTERTGGMLEQSNLAQFNHAVAFFATQLSFTTAICWGLFVRVVDVDYLCCVELNSSGVETKYYNVMANLIFPDVHCCAFLRQLGSSCKFLIVF